MQSQSGGELQSGRTIKLQTPGVQGLRVAYPVQCGRDSRDVPAVLPGQNSEETYGGVPIYGKIEQHERFIATQPTPYHRLGDGAANEEFAGF